jgi:hypothetical protein
MIMLSLSGTKVQFSKDMTCGKICYSYANYTNTKQDTCFNISQLIETQPNVKTELYWKEWSKPKTKWIEDKNWTLVNLKPVNGVPDCVNKSRKTQFMIVGHKNNLQTVKWYSKQINIPDPLWSGVSLTKNITDIKLDNSVIDVKKLSMAFSDDLKIVDSKLDGNGDGICQKGESCCYITDKVTCTDYQANNMKKQLSDAGIE